MTDKYGNLPRCIFLHPKRFNTLQVCSSTIFHPYFSHNFLRVKHLCNQICRVSLRQCMSHWKEKYSHTTIDLGIAPGKLESYQDGTLKETDPMERLRTVKGHLVSFPLEFMCKEDLRPVFKESEYYASPQVFH